MQLQMNWKKGLSIAAMTLAIGFTGATVRAAAPATPQEQHEQDYSKNKNYQMGMREGRNDNAHNRDHYKKRKFKNDEDQRAYESGYQSGHQGDHK